MRGETDDEQVVRSRKERGVNMFGRGKKGPDKVFSHSENCKIQAPIPLDAKTFSHAGSASSPPRPMPPCSGSS